MGSTSRIAGRVLATGLCRAGLAAGSTVAAGCAEPPPFELVDVGFTDDRSVVLTFSRPLASVDAVDPAAFRLSLARSRTSMTQYYEPGSFGLVEDCREQCEFDDIVQQEICAQSCPGTPGVISVAAVGSAEDEHGLVLALTHAVGKPQCDWIDASREENWEAGFVVAYDGSREPPVRAEDGERLESIMAHWVEAEEFFEVDERFPSGAPHYPIACPH